VRHGEGDAKGVGVALDESVFGRFMARKPAAGQHPASRRRSAHLLVVVGETPAGQVGADASQPRRCSRPSRFVADREPRHLLVPACIDSGGGNHGLGDDAVVDPDFAVGRVEDGRSRNAAISVSRPAQIFDTSLLEMPVSAPSALIRSSAERVDTSVDVGLDDDREQRLIDPAPALQLGREERAGAQLPDVWRPRRGMAMPSVWQRAAQSCFRRRCQIRWSRTGGIETARDAR
jgi:hypothetical protein